MAPKKDIKKRPQKPRFQEGDRVLCFRGPFLYKAECLNVSVKYRKVTYQVRYSGVKEKNSPKAEVTNVSQPDLCQPSTSEAWDAAAPGADDCDAGQAFQKRPPPQAEWEKEWVPQSKLLKYNPANLKKLKDLNRANQCQSAEGAVSGPMTREKTSSLQKNNAETSPVATPRRTIVRRNITQVEEPVSTIGDQPKRGRGRPPGSGRGRARVVVPRKKRVQFNLAGDDNIDDDRYQKFLRNTEAKVRIPEELKPWLLDDWDLIVKQNQLFHLPARKTVNSILDDYEDYERLSRSADDKWMQDVSEVVIGIKAYFNVILGSQLLYRFERLQYAEILASLPNVPMCQIYGAPHLLRLFVKVEEMLTYTPLQEQNLVLLLQHMHSFLDYFAKNVSVLFSSNEYDVALPEYYRMALF
ncbi:mortality factor 4-like protein 1 [Sarcophilus harrisii]|uniref:MRG domain-containing protein n=1 Tax=Sarcophilus harrisii TaxID=9305 RepID=A0A7N4NU70_SARHA